MEPADEVRLREAELRIAVEYFSGSLSEAQELWEEASGFLAKHPDDSPDARAKVEEFCARAKRFVSSHPDFRSALTERLIEKGVKLANEIISDYGSREEEGKVSQAQRESMGRVVQALLDSARDLLKASSGPGEGEASEREE